MNAQPDFESIKAMTIIALFSDDFLMDRLVLKGGNAMNIVYKMYNRASIDFDFSMESDFSAEELGEVGERINRALNSIFKDYGMVIMDYTFGHRPQNRSPQDTGFWGGYAATFKLASTDDYAKYRHNIDKLRKNHCDRQRREEKYHY